MTAQRAVPRVQDVVCANDDFKGRFRTIFWGSMIFAVVGHFSVFAYWPEITAEDFTYTAEEITAVELPPEVEIPPPPRAVARPATPVIATTAVDEDITIAPTTFAMNPVDELPPPPSATERLSDVGASPTFTPFTVAPEIINRDEIVDAMMKNYPRILRDAGVGGEVRVFFFIDAEGLVQNTRIDQSSGYELLDLAALELADMYRFSPALNRDTRVPVWVSFPVRYQVIR